MITPVDLKIKRVNVCPKCGSDKIDKLHQTEDYDEHWVCSICPAALDDDGRSIRVFDTPVVRYSIPNIDNLLEWLSEDYPLEKGCEIADYLRDEIKKVKA